MIERLPPATDGNDRPLELTPGFHSLSRAVYDGVLERGGIVLKLFCACDPIDPLARVHAYPTKSRGNFQYSVVGRTTLELSPAIDTRTGWGHFVSADPWTVQVESLPTGLTTKYAKPKAAKRRAAALAVDAKPAKLGGVQGCPTGQCPHPLEVHSPCSICGCPNIKKATRGRRT